MFPCNKFISSCIIVYIDFVVMTCIIMYDMLKRLINSVYAPREKSMQNCKSAVTMVFERYFNQLLHCTGMECIRNDDVSFTRSRRVN